VLEIGTAIAYTTIRIARNLKKKSNIHTIELSEDNIETAKEYIEHSGDGDKIKLIEGDALSVMPRLKKKYDLIFLDSDKEDFIIKGTIWEGERLHDLYTKASLPWEWHAELFKVAKEEGLTCFSTPFDITAVDFLEELNCPIYKIASFEITDIPLIKYIAEKGKPMISAAICKILTPEMAAADFQYFLNNSENCLNSGLLSRKSSFI